MSEPTPYRQSSSLIIRHAPRHLLVIHDGIAFEVEIPTRHVGHLALVLHWLRLQVVRVARWQGAWWCLAQGSFDVAFDGRGDRPW